MQHAVLEVAFFAGALSSVIGFRVYGFKFSVEGSGLRLYFVGFNVQASGIDPEYMGPGFRQDFGRPEVPKNSLRLR